MYQLPEYYALNISVVIVDMKTTTYFSYGQPVLTVSRSAGTSLVQDFFRAEEFSAFDNIAWISISTNTNWFMYSWMYYLHDSTRLKQSMPPIPKSPL